MIYSKIDKLLAFIVTNNKNLSGFICWQKQNNIKCWIEKPSLKISKCTRVSF